MADPTLPQADVEVPAFSLPTGTEHFPTTGAELQTALNNAALNDIIWLDPAIDYDRGGSGLNFPNKASGSGWIYVISENYAGLPAEHYRVAPSDASNMARLSCNAQSQFLGFATNSHHYRLVGLHVEANTNQSVDRLIQIETGGSVSTQPHHILIDRCYIHGQDGTGTNLRGIRLGGKHLGVLGCYIDNFKDPNRDSQAIWISEGEGPFLVRNNYLEGNSENILIGESPDASVSALNPTDITIEYNYFDKREVWRTGTAYRCKNIWESKSSRRTLLQYNVFRHCWSGDPNGQDGAWLNITSNAPDTGMPWCQTEELTIRRNLAFRVEVGIGMNGTNGLGEDPVTNVLYEDNVCIVGELAAGTRRCIDVIGDDAPIGLAFRHNTLLLTGSTGQAAFFEHSPAAPDVLLTDNIVSRGTNGVDGPGSNEGTDTLDTHHDIYTFSTNAVIGASSGSYPSGNYFPANIAAMNFVNYQADGSGDYSLTPGTTFAAGGASDASDGTDLGARWNDFKNHIAAALSGEPFSEGTSGEAALTFANTGTLLGTGRLLGAATQTFGQTATLRWPGYTSGSAALAFAVSGTLTQPGYSLAQEGFRWRNDDGDEATATWKAAQDANVSVPLMSPLRLRVLVDATGNPDVHRYRLEYKKSTDSAFRAALVGEGDVRLVDSANILPSGEDTTPQLAFPAGKNVGDFHIGRLWDDENGVDSINIEETEYTELEWSIVLAAGGIGEVYDLRVTRSV
jgi:hypothetical protein